MARHRLCDEPLDERGGVEADGMEGKGREGQGEMTRE